MAIHPRTASHSAKQPYNRSSVRLLETRSCTTTTELLGFASARIGDEEKLVVLDKKLLEFALLSFVLVLLVESNDRFGNCLSDGQNLRGRTATTDAHADVEVLELVSAEEEEWLKRLQPQGRGLEDVHRLAVNPNDTGSGGHSGHSGGILLPSESLHLFLLHFVTHLSQIW